MLEKALALGMTEAEYNQVVAILGRVPSATELAMYSVEWSEHCGYPRSRALLKLLPKDGHYASVAGADTGGIEVEPGLFVVFKMESHNHPSQVEPRQGAATGIGGIIRDIFTVGARPIANLNSLRFGMLDDPQHGAKARYLFQGVVDGISFYGNCLHGDEVITVRQGGQVRTVALGEWCEAVIKENGASYPTAEVLSFDEKTGRATWNEIEGVFRRRAAELVTVSTHLGRTWRVTSDHPMMVRKSGAWQVKAASELHPGDALALLGDWPEVPSATPQLDLIEMFGSRRSNIRVLHPVKEEEKAAVQAILRRHVASAQKRFSLMNAGRFPVAVWLELEETLGWNRADARLTLFGGKAHAVPALIEVGADFARLLGYYSAEGCLSENGTPDKIIWTFGAQEDEYVADLSAILRGLGLRFSHRRNENTQSIWLSSWFLGALWRELGLGANAKTKRVPSLISQSNQILKIEFLRGAMRGDGSVCLKKEGSSSPLKIAFASASRALFEGVQLLLGEQGLFGAVHVRAASDSLICGRTHATVPLYVVEFSAHEAVSRFPGWFDAARNEKIEVGLSRYRDLSQSYARHQKQDGFATVAVKEVQREQGD
ncbi:MAG TPA: AIR synthase related protein, partial [Abditibacterium sp.]